MRKGVKITDAKKQKGQKISQFVGILIIAIGLLLNERTFEKTIVPDGTIESSLYRVLIIIGQLVIIIFGLYVFWKRPRISLANIFLLALSVLFSILLAEVILQLFYELPPVKSGWRYMGPESEIRNQLGFRGQPVEYSDDDYVILLLGDSQVAASACDFEWMPERRLQHHLNSMGKDNVKVFTLGTDGYGQDQQLLVSQEYYQRHRADLVILWQTPTNDVWDNMFPTHGPTNGTPKPTFWLEGGELKGPNEQMGQELLVSSVKLLAIWQRLILDRDGTWEEKYFPHPYTPIYEYKGPVSQDWQERWDRKIGDMRHENLDNEKSHLAISLTPRSKRMEYGLALTQRLLQKISMLVSSHNGKFIIFRSGNTEQHFSDETVHVLNEKFYKTSRSQFEENMDYINKGFISFTIPITIQNWRVGPTDSHLNERGNDQVMKDLVRKLESLEVLPDTMQ